MKRDYLLYVLLVLFTSISSCESEEDSKSLSVDKSELNFDSDGGTKSIVIQTTAETWSITNSIPEWLELSATQGSIGTTNISLTISSRTLETRSAVLMISANGAESIEVAVTQLS